jgi:hypothetical protein
MLFLQRWGSSKYPGIEQARIDTTRNPDSIDAAVELKHGVVCVGCGKGAYDEHGTGEYTSAAELVARDLNLMDNRAVKRILEYVTYCDRNRDVRPHELPSLIKQWYRLHRDNERLVIDRVMACVADELDSALAFQKTFATIKVDRKWFPLLGQAPGAPKRDISYAVFDRCEDHNVPVVARLKGVDIVITRNPRGNTQIFTKSNKSEDRGDQPAVDIADVVRVLRMTEMLNAGEDPGRLSTDYLRSADTIPESPRWHYLANGQTVLNGSDLSADEAPPTTLSLDVIIKAIKSGCRPMPVAPSTQMTEALRTASVGK